MCVTITFPQNQCSNIYGPHFPLVIFCIARRSLFTSILYICLLYTQYTLAHMDVEGLYLYLSLARFNQNIRTHTHRKRKALTHWPDSSLSTIAPPSPASNMWAFRIAQFSLVSALTVKVVLYGRWLVYVYERIACVRARGAEMECKAHTHRA